MTDQPNTRLADELRRGGIALLAESVASMFQSVNLSWSEQAWLESLHQRVAAIPPGNVAQPEQEQLSALEVWRLAEKDAFGGIPTGPHPDDSATKIADEFAACNRLLCRDVCELERERDEALAKLSASEARVRELEDDIKGMRQACLRQTSRIAHEALAVNEKLKEAERTIAELRTDLAHSEAERATSNRIIDKLNVAARRARVHLHDADESSALALEAALSALDESSQLSSPTPLGAHREACEALLDMYWLYPNYRVDSRGPVGLIRKVTGLLWPELDAYIDQNHFDAARKKFFCGSGDCKAGESSQREDQK